MMKWFLTGVLVLATVWDGFTTIYGTILIFGTGPFQLFAAFLFSMLIMAFMLNTMRLMRWHRGFATSIAKVFWFVALIYDFYTSWVGNSNLITQNRGDTAEIFMLIGLSLLVIASPILLSAMWQARSKSEQPMEGSSQSTAVEGA
ncbi:MAG TPA: hypothetical protein PKE64_14475 [Anaerolineae bacterium]|nr:hypothetical protein [Anaerolineae bacterium]HMR65208.1 hypothetical protein [Anaerolineae bacterium]